MNWLKRIKSRLFPAKSYVVFCTTRNPAKVDEYLVFDDKATAYARYRDVLNDPDLYCAGISVIVEGTDWH